MGTLYVVATPIGNLGDISSRGLDTLRAVDLIAVEDTRQTIKLLNHFNIKNPMLSYHKFNEKDRCEEIIKKLELGQDIALVSDAGTPCISDPGYILIKEVKKKGMEVIGVPGPSAVINALATSGLPTDNFAFYGFLSTDNTKLRKQLNQIRNSEINTFVIYESPKRIVSTIKKLKDKLPDSTVSICSDMTKKFERNFFGKIEEVYDKIKNDTNIAKGEYTIAICKNQIETEHKEEISLESQIIDKMIKDNYTLKAAIKNIADTNTNIRKNDLYEASLKLKELFDKE